MNAQEWDKIVAVLAADWPHALPPDEALSKWGNDLADEDASEVLTAVEALYRDGEKFAPNGGQIRAKMVEIRMAQVPDVEDAYGLAMHAASSVGYDEGLDWLRQRQPIVALAAERFPWRSLCLEPMDDGVRRGQFNKIFASVRAKHEKGERYQGLPGGGGGDAGRQIAPRPLREVIGEIRPALPVGREEEAA